MIQFAPIFTHWMTHEPMPTCVFAPTITPPASAAFGLTCAKSPISQSCSMIAPVFIIAPSPITARAFMTAWGITTAPSPIFALLLTTALGWIKCATPKPVFFTLFCRIRLILLSPIATITSAFSKLGSNLSTFLPSNLASSKNTTSPYPQALATSATTAPCPLKP